jgi:hypothetical protein
MSTRAERSALFVGMTGVRSLSIGRDSREVRRQRHPHDEAVVAVIDCDPCATMSRVTRKPKARRRSAKARRRRGAATARRGSVGQGRPARSPRHCANAHIGPMTCFGGAVWRWRPQPPEGAPAPSSRMGDEVPRPGRGAGAGGRGPPRRERVQRA